MHDHAPTDPVPAGDLERCRRELTDVAYRLLGTMADADDAVQEAYARWYRLTPAARAEVDSVIAWLVRVTSRICLDVLRSAHHRRQRYTGEWLPEPLPPADRWRSDREASHPVDPGERVTRDESVSTALLVVLDTLTPPERVAFVLHDVFGRSFAEVGRTLDRAPAACRQLAVSARRRIAAQAPARGVAPADRALVAAVKAAWDADDIDALTALLAPDVVAITDSGGRVSAPVGPVRGAPGVAALLLRVRDRQPDLTIHEVQVSGRPGLEARGGGATVAAIAVGSDASLVTRLWIVRNPAKLIAWNGDGSG